MNGMSNFYAIHKKFEGNRCKITMFNDKVHMKFTQNSRSSFKMNYV